MTQFLDCRMQKVGGELATSVAVNQGTSIDDYAGLAMSDLAMAIRGRNVLIATHGFNVDRAGGIASLSNWEKLLQLGPSSAFVGLLWPGDSVWAHGLDYPEEPKIADEAGALMAPFIDANFAAAASVSFASHSLGARLVLATIAKMNLPVRRVALMAGAIDDDCLTNEFAAAAAKVGQISALSSSRDAVLAAAFPLGNLFAGLIDAGHPWWRAAIGHSGPVTPWPSNFNAPFEIPDEWWYQHGDYLKITDPRGGALPIPTAVPPNGSQPVAASYGADKRPVSGWQSEFSAAVVSSWFR